MPGRLRFPTSTRLGDATGLTVLDVTSETGPIEIRAAGDLAVGRFLSAVTGALVLQAGHVEASAGSVRLTAGGNAVLYEGNGPTIAAPDGIEVDAAQDVVLRGCWLPPPP